jgi:ABC-type polysaccharide/polyol phosphate export permease
MAGDASDRRPVLELEGEVTPVGVLLSDLAHRIGLVPMLAAKDFHSRYRSTTFGVLWSALLPLLQGAVLAVVFTKVVRIHLSGGDSYPVYVTTGTVMWAYYSSTLTGGASIIVDQGGIAGKVYFPRLVLSVAPALSNGVGFVISMLVTLVLVPIFGVGVGWHLVLLPVAMAIVVVLAVVFGALFSMAHVYFRDVKYIVQAALMVLFYATPVIYAIDEPRGLLRAAIVANPTTGPLQLAHFAMFGHASDLALALLSTAAFTGGGIVLTLAAYRRYERVACDRL